MVKFFWDSANNRKTGWLEKNLDLQKEKSGLEEVLYLHDLSCNKNLAYLTKFFLKKYIYIYLTACKPKDFDHQELRSPVIIKFCDQNNLCSENYITFQEFSLAKKNTYISIQNKIYYLPKKVFKK